jgi:flagella basal body P-ring formation protein FlgA
LRTTALAAIVIAVWSVKTVSGATLRLRPECQCRRAVVTVGDVAEVVSSDPEEAAALSAMELFPTPPPGTRRFFDARQLQDFLIGRGINPVEHRFSGSSRVAVVAAAEGKDASEGPLALSASKRAQRRICDAVVRYLRRQTSQTEPWTVDVSLDDAQARRLNAAEGEISIRGGATPWVGIQRFEATVPAAGGPVRFAFDAQVTLPPAVVVATRSLSRGAVIRAGDVELQKTQTFDGTADRFHSLDDVLGKETTRTIAAGRILDRKSLREPLVVRRGEVITVYARSAGVRVRTMARARQEGSLGELIAVESLLDRTAYFARVSGIQEAEVYARPPQADSR